jgi:hypothetical protein
VTAHESAQVGNGNLYGQIIGASATVGSYGLFHAPFSGCLPPQPTKDLSLASLCTDPITLHHSMRLRNIGSVDHAVTWSDRDSAQIGAFAARAGTDTFFDVLDGDTVHHIVVRSGSTTLEQTTTTRRCAGTITVSKLVTGPAPPVGPWRIAIEGDNGFATTRDLGDGQRATVAVPGSYEAGQVPVGEVAGGARYAITEADPLGAVVSMDKPLVTILDGQAELSRCAMPSRMSRRPSRRTRCHRSRRCRPGRRSRPPGPTSWSPPRWTAAPTSPSPRASRPA